MRQHRLLSIEQPRPWPGYRYRSISRLLVCGLGALLAACGSTNAANTPPAPTIPIQAPPTKTQPLPTTIVTPPATIVPAQPTARATTPSRIVPTATPLVAATAQRIPGAPARPGGPADGDLPSPVQDPVAQLRHTLELADTELRAVSNSADLLEARLHAEAVVNTLVGLRGRWYGDADGDGKITDPSDRQGVLPGIGVTAPARGLNMQRPLGWGLIVYLKGDQHTQQLIQETIMGDMKRWINQPERRYDDIERAIAGTDMKSNMVSKLDGHTMRAVAWARLILTQASSIEEAQIYAGRGTTDTAASLEAARAIK